MMAWISQSIIERVQLDICCGTQWPGSNPSLELHRVELSVATPCAYCALECIL